MVENAKIQFDLLPAAVRDKFQNDPAQLFDFVMDAGNRDEAIKLGLIAKPDEKPLTLAELNAHLNERDEKKQAAAAAQTS